MKKLLGGLFILAAIGTTTPFAMAKSIKRPVKKSAPTFFQMVKKARAECEDGTLSFSKVRRGACSAHGGVMKWLR